MLYFPLVTLFIKLSNVFVISISSSATSLKGFGFGNTILNWFIVFWTVEVNLFKFERTSLIWLFVFLNFSNSYLLYGILKAFNKSSSCKISSTDIILSTIVSPVLIESKVFLANVYNLSPVWSCLMDCCILSLFNGMWIIFDTMLK